MIKKIRDPLHWHPYRSPLTSQVEALETPSQPQSLCANEEEPEKKVTFNLPPDHVNKKSSAWRKYRVNYAYAQPDTNGKIQNSERSG